MPCPIWNCGKIIRTISWYLECFPMVLWKVLKRLFSYQEDTVLLDNDLPGRQAAKKLARKYTLMEYEVFVRLPPMEKTIMLFCSIKRKTKSFPAW